MKLAAVCALVLGSSAVCALAFAWTPAPVSESIATSLVEDGHSVRLELLVSRPQGPGPFPTVVFNHGSTGRGDDPSLFRRSWSSTAVAGWFVDRGWMVVFPQRRGRGGSDGRYDEGFEPDRRRYACRAAHALPGVDRAIEDLDAVMAHVRARPDVRPDRILLAGQSRGGILSVVYAGERPDAVVGVVNFVGGWVSDRCADAANVNASTFRRGARFVRPMLFLYGDGDPFYALAHSRQNFDAYVAAGGTGRFESFAVPGQGTGHALIAHPDLWSEHLARYLESIR